MILQSYNWVSRISWVISIRRKRLPKAKLTTLLVLSYRQIPSLSTKNQGLVTCSKRIAAKKAKLFVYLIFELTNVLFPGITGKAGIG